MNYADYICGVNLKERNKMETINIQFQVPSTGQYTLDEFKKNGTKPMDARDLLRRLR